LPSDDPPLPGYHLGPATGQLDWMPTIVLREGLLRGERLNFD